MTVTVDPALFGSAAIPDEVRALNDRLIREAAAMPDPWAFPPAAVREARKAGRGLFPFSLPSPRAENIEIPGPRGPIGLHVVRPQGGPASGVLLHLHYGGWTLGTADMHDWLFERFADEAGAAVVSVEYRLAPEWPYPAGPDDCEAAALWLQRMASGRFGTDRLVIGGESAGAHLSLVTMLRLRDRHRMQPFRGAVLNAGCYDLAGTPSVRAATGPKLVLGRRDVENFRRSFVPAHVPLDDADISPLHAALHGLPPALLLVGTADPLLDDSLFLASRLAAAGNGAELAVYPGGCHVFEMFPGAQSEACIARQVAFLRRTLADG